MLFYQVPTVCPMSKKICMYKNVGQISALTKSHQFSVLPQSEQCLSKGAWFLPKVSETYRGNTTTQLEHSDEHSAIIRDTRHASKLELAKHITLHASSQAELFTFTFFSCSARTLLVVCSASGDCSETVSGRCPRAVPV